MFDQKHELSVATDGACVLFRGKIVVPEDAKLFLLKAAHWGHLGAKRMLIKITGGAQPRM